MADLTGKSQGQRGSKLLITQEKTETEGLKKIGEKRKTYFREKVTTIQLHSTQALRWGWGAEQIAHFIHCPPGLHS